MSWLANEPPESQICHGSRLETKFTFDARVLFGISLDF